MVSCAATAAPCTATERIATALIGIDVDAPSLLLGALLVTIVLVEIERQTYG